MVALFMETPMNEYRMGNELGPVSSRFPSFSCQLPGVLLEVGPGLGKHRKGGGRPTQRPLGQAIHRRAQDLGQILAVAWGSVIWVIAPFNGWYDLSVHFSLKLIIDRSWPIRSPDNSYT